jgi:hypothetical protein
MNTQQPQGTENTEHAAALHVGGSAELVATLTVLAFVAIAAASLIFVTPQSFEASAGPQPIVDNVMASEPPEKPFHERHPVQPSGAQTDAPTF